MRVNGTATSKSIVVYVYSNYTVAADKPRVDILTSIIRSKIPGSLTMPMAKQPYFGDYTVGYVIPSNKGSYFTLEQLGVKPPRVAALTAFVRRGGALVLLDGYDYTNKTNSLLPVIAAVLGTDPLCRAIGVTSDLKQQRRISTGYFMNLDESIKVSRGLGLSNLNCETGKSIYSAIVNKTPVAGAIFWPLGRGAVYWIGSSFQRPNLRGFQQVLVAALSTAVDAWKQGPPLSLAPRPPQPPPPFSSIAVRSFNIVCTAAAFRNHFSPAAVTTSIRATPICNHAISTAEAISPTAPSTTTPSSKSSSAITQAAVAVPGAPSIITGPPTTTTATPTITDVPSASNSAESSTDTTAATTTTATTDIGSTSTAINATAIPTSVQSLQPTA
ncbi:hypothetical protein VOLCADRAFT_89352 [Volvox carteri f. nagariensis]|uniref:Uncharacterized protein n=1 Tax=Volvox carteri f. nagariensis TaxID=3068 RepID=D8TRH4_VOLCA|nr:uncharacterized protein VOLCADRAFT_89352 [Volvox carteri f. nagariensis]EFJ49993.1 hypothetical protein VOLCADRAFT_89352 [Volvox carteri f. nagariensis]|eukprot:XP_002949058.1 hypothetical protein VOLCADRAFT_89352 [Volvox carteri f. nagariensis]